MNRSLYISDVVQNNLITLYGDIGKQWIQNLPQFISEYENKWGFKAGKCFSDAQFNVVLEATKKNQPVVFKSCVPNKEFTTEVLALSHYNCIGAVNIIQSDVDYGAMLLEKITPGDMLEKCESIEIATQHAISVCRQLHKPIHNVESFPTLGNWCDGLHRASDQLIDKKLLSRAKSLSLDLLQSQHSPVLLHGDLHYANLLQNHDHYVAIDPKGVIGEPEFEIPLPRVTHHFNQAELLCRLDCFIELSGFDKKRIEQWLFVKAVLAVCWTVEDSGSVTDFTKRFLTVAEMMIYKIA